MAKRLYRSKTEKMIAGICGGLAEYTNTDPTLWRIGMVFLAFISGGVVVLAYLVCILIIPEAPDTPKKTTKKAKS